MEKDASVERPEVEVVVQVWRVGRSELQQELPCVIHKAALHLIYSHGNSRVLAKNSHHSLVAFAFGYDASDGVGDIDERNCSSSGYSNLFIMSDERHSELSTGPSM